MLPCLGTPPRLVGALRTLGERGNFAPSGSRKCQYLARLISCREWVSKLSRFTSNAGDPDESERRRYGWAPCGVADFPSNPRIPDLERTFWGPLRSARKSDTNTVGNTRRMTTASVRLDWHGLCSTSRRIDSFADEGEICREGTGVRVSRK